LRQIIKLAAWVPAVIMAIVISASSGQDGNESQGLSDRVAAVIVDLADTAGIVDIQDEEMREACIDAIQFPIRKAAHMTEYAIFTCCVLFALYVWQMRDANLYCAGLIITALYAASDEFHQLFIPGRSGQFSDVLIDTAGGLVAILIIIAINGKNIIKYPKCIDGNK